MANSNNNNNNRRGESPNHKSNQHHSNERKQQDSRDRRADSPVSKENITSSMKATPAKSTRSHDQQDNIQEALHQAKDYARHKAQQVKGRLEDASEETGLALPKLTTVILVAILVALGAFYVASLGAHKAVSAFERSDVFESKPFYKQAAHRVKHAVRHANPFHREPKHFTLVDWFADKDESYVDKIDRTLREYLHTAERLAGYEPAKPKGIWGKAKDSVSDSIDAAKDKVSDTVDAAKDKASESYESLQERYQVLKEYLSDKGVELNDTKNDVKDKANETLVQAAKKKREYEHKMNSAWNDYVTKNTDKFKRTARMAQKEAELKSRSLGRRAENIKQRVRGVVSDAADEVQDKYDSAKDYAKDVKHRVIHGAEKAKHHARNAKDTAEDAVEDAKHHAKRAGRDLRDSAAETLEDGADHVHGLRNKVHHQAGLWKERAKEFTESWFGKNQQVRLVEEAQDRLEDLEEKLERQRWRLEWLKKNHIEA